MGLQKKFRPIRKELPNSTSYGNPQACLTIRLSVSSSIMNLCMMMSLDRKKTKIHLLRPWGVSSVPFPFRFPFQLHCELVSSLLALDATELVSQPLTQMVVEMINIHVISVQQKR